MLDCIYILHNIEEKFYVLFYSPLFCQFYFVSQFKDNNQINCKIKL